MLHGCFCDGYPDREKTSAASGVSDRGLWEALGPACAQRSCPFGSDTDGPTLSTTGKNPEPGPGSDLMTTRTAKGHTEL